MPYIIAIAFAFILGSLAFALYFVFKDRGTTNRAVNALTLRVGLSIAIFLLILLSWHFGWIHPTGLR
jgi:inner membrane protein involved in colicin E2 resistance